MAAVPRRVSGWPASSVAVRGSSPAGHVPGKAPRGCVGCPRRRRAEHGMLPRRPCPTNHSEPAVDSDAMSPVRTRPASSQVKVWRIGISSMVRRRVLVRETFSLREPPGGMQVAMGMVPCRLSPRLRGTLGRRRLDHAQRRFIPASAGNTNPACGRSKGRSVHPRVCGEHIGRPSGGCAMPGSSPRLRGTLASNSLRRAVVRFIPASAGNTACAASTPPHE